MSILDKLENVSEEDAHIKAIRAAEFTDRPMVWMDASEICNIEGYADLSDYCFNMARGLRRFNERKLNVQDDSR